jgi:hypothetical protein
MDCSYRVERNETVTSQVRLSGLTLIQAVRLESLTYATPHYQLSISYFCEQEAITDLEKLIWSKYCRLGRFIRVQEAPDLPRTDQSP